MVTRKEFREKDAKRKAALKAKQESYLKPFREGNLPEGFMFPAMFMREEYSKGRTIYILGYPIRRK